MTISLKERMHIESMLGPTSPEIKFALINRHVLDALKGSLTQSASDGANASHIPSELVRTNVVLWGGEEQLSVLLNIAEENAIEFRWGNASRALGERRRELVMFAPHSRGPVFIEVRDADQPSQDQRLREA